MKNADLKAIVKDEVAHVLGQREQGRREILGRAAVLGLEDKAREMLSTGSSEQAVAEFLLDEHARRNPTAASVSGRRSMFERVEDVPDDVFTRMICRPILFSPEDGGPARPGETSRQHTRTGDATTYDKVEDVPDDVFTRAIMNPSPFGLR